MPALYTSADVGCLAVHANRAIGRVGDMEAARTIEDGKRVEHHKAFGWPTEPLAQQHSRRLGHQDPTVPCVRVSGFGEFRNAARRSGVGRLREFATKAVSCPSRQEPDSSKTRFRRT